MLPQRECQSPPPAFDRIEIVEPDPRDCPDNSMPPEGNTKLRNYRLMAENLRAYTPTGDVHTSPTKGKVVAKFELSTAISAPRARILDLLRPEDPGRETIEAIVKPVSRRGLARPLDEDTRRFLQRALFSPSPYSAAATPEPSNRSPEPTNRSPEPSIRSPEPQNRSPEMRFKSPEFWNRSREARNMFLKPTLRVPPQERPRAMARERSLAEELEEAEEEERLGFARTDEIHVERPLSQEVDAEERERLGRLALAVEDDERGLVSASRRLDSLLAESHLLHAELASIHRDLQVGSARAVRCAEAARALLDETRALRYLDDVLALLSGNLEGATRAKDWPFAALARDPGRNYVV